MFINAKLANPSIFSLSGIKAVVKKDGHGTGNWGTIEDELEAQTADTSLEAPAEEEAPVEVTPDAEPEPVEEEPKTLTLQEYKEQQKASKTKVHLSTKGSRRANDGKNVFSNMVEVHKSKPVESKVEVVLKDEKQNQEVRLYSSIDILLRNRSLFSLNLGEGNLQDVVEGLVHPDRATSTVAVEPVLAFIRENRNTLKKLVHRLQRPNGPHAEVAVANAEGEVESESVVVVDVAVGHPVARSTLSEVVAVVEPLEIAQPSAEANVVVGGLVEALEAAFEVDAINTMENVVREAHAALLQSWTVKLTSQLSNKSLAMSLCAIG